MEIQKQSHWVKWKCLVATPTTFLFEEAFPIETVTEIILVTVDEITEDTIRTVEGATAIATVGTTTGAIGAIVMTEVIETIEDIGTIGAIEAVETLLREMMETVGSAIAEEESHGMGVQKCQVRMTCTKKFDVGNVILLQLAPEVSIQDAHQVQKRVCQHMIAIERQKTSMFHQLIEHRPEISNNGMSRRARLILLQRKEVQKRLQLYEKRNENSWQNMVDCS